MKRWKLVALSVAAVSMASWSAFAGQRQTYPVVAGQTYFEGSLGSTRNSADGISSIDVYVIDADTYSYAYFISYTADGQYHGCLTYSPALITAARSVSSDSSLFVQWGPDGYCTSVTVTHSSEDEPKR